MIEVSSSSVSQAVLQNRLLLESVLGFQLPGLVERLKDKLALTQKEAEHLFDDTKRFLFLCGMVPGPLAPSLAIDEGWHLFILFTREYAQFCNHFFGRFIHHAPKTAQDVALADGSAVRHTLEAARAMFGDLSDNWRMSAGGNCSEQCNPSTNCQEPPTCAKPAG